MKKPFIIFVWIIAIIVVLGFVKDQIIKTVVVIAAKQVAGAEVTMDHFSLGLIKQTVRIKGFKMYNPPGFPNEVMVDVPEISVDCDIQAILKGTIHLPYLRLNLSEVQVIKNKEGKMNVNELKFAQKKDEGAPPEIKIKLDLVSLNIGRVTFTDYSARGNPSVKVYDIHIKEKQYKNITNASQLGALVMMEALKSTAIKGVATYGKAALLGAKTLPVGVASGILGQLQERLK